ncbi:MAG: hypothetical protein IJQ61_09630 [Bacteroidales bacterium]|nr:hypothetical protein [Bacteroidales bacterium]
MKYCLPLLFLALASACSTVRQLPSTDSTKVEVRTETVIEKDTVFVELPLVVERVVVLDTVSVLDNQFAASSAVVSGGVLRHSLETKPVKMPAVVDKEIVYRDSLIYRDRVQTVTVEVERKLTGWQQAKLKVGGFCFFALLLIAIYFLITQFINLKLF